MPQSIKIEPQDDYLLVKMSGSFDSTKAKQFLSEILKAAEGHSLFKALVDVREVKGSIPTMARFKLGEFMGKIGAGAVQTAILELPGQVDDERFFETVAINRGANVKVFTSTYDEALEWILRES